MLSKTIALAILAKLAEAVLNEPCSQTNYQLDVVNNVTINSGGIDRTLGVYLPPQFASAPLPAVIHWHGFNRYYPILDYHINVTKVLEQAQKSGYVVILPLGTPFGGLIPKFLDFLNLSGRYGWNTNGLQGGQLGVDDSVFAEDVLKFVSEKLCVDSKRIHTAGFSNGAFQAYDFGCTTPHIAAVGANAGSMTRDFLNKCKVGNPVPVQSFHSLADPIVPIHGNSLWASQEEIDSMWRTRNGCTGDASEGPVIAYRSSTTTCRQWKCPGAPVEKCTVGPNSRRAFCEKCDPHKGLDHCWIGGGSGGFPTCEPLPEDVDATEHMFEFWDSLAEQASSRVLV